MGTIRGSSLGMNNGNDEIMYSKYVKSICFGSVYLCVYVL